MKSYVTSGTGSQQTLTGSQDEKVAIYQTLADAEADLANLEAGQIVATPDTGDEYAQPVDSVTDGDMHAVTSNAVFDTYAVITASSTILTGKPPISQDSVIKIMFTSAISGSNTTTGMSISYNGTSYPVKVGKNGSLANFVASKISSGVYRYLQAYTTLELVFDGTQFIIIGNPVVLSSADYTIYADGSKVELQLETVVEGSDIDILLNSLGISYTYLHSAFRKIITDISSYNSGLITISTGGPLFGFILWKYSETYWVATLQSYMFERETYLMLRYYNGDIQLRRIK